MVTFAKYFTLRTALVPIILFDSHKDPVMEVPHITILQMRKPRCRNVHDSKQTKELELQLGCPNDTNPFSFYLTKYKKEENKPAFKYLNNPTGKGVVGVDHPWDFCTPSPSSPTWPTGAHASTHTLTHTPIQRALKVNGSGHLDMHTCQPEQTTGETCLHIQLYLQEVCGDWDFYLHSSYVSYFHITLANLISANGIGSYKHNET